VFRFFESGWLYALATVPLLALLFWASARSRRKAMDTFGDSDLVQKLTATVSVASRRWKAVMSLAAVAFAVLALARPQFGSRVETVRSLGQDIVVAVDLSQSMLAEDVSPNRFERARLAILRLMEGLDGDRIGLVAFAADAFVQSPLTTDYDAAGLFLNAMHPCRFRGPTSAPLCVYHSTHSTRVHATRASSSS
jgi:Ca-activated chloride channel family protein